MNQEESEWDEVNSIKQEEDSGGTAMHNKI